MPQSLDKGARGQILGMRAAGASIKTISNHLHVPPTTVRDTICKHQEHGHLRLLPIPGRPRKLNDGHLFQLARVAQQNQCKKLAEIKKAHYH
ncbi:hypothetical protein O181_099783 [Austropuccinia psidii MF-1]|uniref:Uncharacterized protein n=1 Tax=Austropuccinia psidii MF-1 TaxID=1389203 RepID=A0A9Q3JDD6_9BASI|nr:hypothetical protein [Austropuccinia psidii MF-1]